VQPLVAPALILFGLSGFCFFATTLQQFKHHVRDILLQRKPNRVAHLFYATDKHDLLAQWHRSTALQKPLNGESKHRSDRRRSKWAYSVS
jgi:hypothetical protein